MVLMMAWQPHSGALVWTDAVHLLSISNSLGKIKQTILMTIWHIISNIYLYI